MQVRNVAELNRTIVEGKFGDLIRVNEALHEKKIAEIADQIHQRMDKVRVVLIAGAFLLRQNLLRKQIMYSAARAGGEAAQGLSG